MNVIETNWYDYLRSKRYVVHEEHEQFIRPETLAEMREYEAIEFYSRELPQRVCLNKLTSWT